MDKLKIALVQSDIIWESISQNLSSYSKKLIGIGLKTDLIILPEMFATGFSMNVDEISQEENGEIFNWMKQLAASENTAIYGSIIIKDTGKYYNRAYFVYPDGSFVTYNKKHLFSLAGEDEIYTAGNDRRIIEFKGWKIMPQICYDLRFPIWSRNDLNYDLLIYIASWPEKRIYAWQTLLKARAIENMTFVAGVNRVGTDGSYAKYSGESAVISPMGEVMIEIKNNEDKIEIIEIDKSFSDKVRSKLGFLNDIDKFYIE